MPPSPVDQNVPLTRLAGSALGLLLFGMMVLRGLCAGNSVEVVLNRAMWGLLGGLAIGLCAGGLAQRILRDGSGPRTDSHSSNPNTGEPSGDGAAEAASR